MIGFSKDDKRFHLPGNKYSAVSILLSTQHFRTSVSFLYPEPLSLGVSQCMIEGIQNYEVEVIEA